MSGGTMVVVAVFVAAVGAVVGVAWWRGSRAWKGAPRVPNRRVAAFAARESLTIPEDLVPWLTARLRRRQVGGLPAVAVLLGLLAWYLSGLVSSLLAFSRNVSPRQPPGPFLLMAANYAAIGAAVALGHAWDRRRLGRATGPGPASARLSDVLPEPSIWFVRAMSLAPALVAAVILALWQVAAGRLWLVGAVIIGAAATATAAGRAQRAILGGRVDGDPGSWPVEAALRAETVRALAMGAVSLDLLGAYLLPGLAGIGGFAGHLLGFAVTSLAWACWMATVFLQASRRFRRYYRGRYLAGDWMG